MLRTPVNVIPQNSAVDCKIHGEGGDLFQFTFSGKNAVGYECLYYDCMTEKIVGSREWTDEDNVWHIEYTKWLEKFEEGRIYNNEIIYRYVTYFSDPLLFQNGRNYKYTMRIIQNKHDNIMLSGRLKENSSESNKIYVARGLVNAWNGLRPPATYFDDSEFYSIYIQIGYERHKIVEIIMDNSNYDTLVLDEGFTEMPKKGDQWKAISNYILTPFYFFKCRKYPELTVDYKYNADGTLYCSADYYQEQNVDVKKYKWELYKNINDNYELVAESPFLFNERLDFTFSEYLDIAIYKAKCIVYTQDDVVVETETDAITPTGATITGVTSAVATWDSESKAVDIAISVDSANIGQVDCSIYRETIGENSIRLIAKIPVYYSGHYKDITAGNKSYRYAIEVSKMVSGVDTKYIGGGTNIINVTEIEGWTFTSLSYNENEQIYDYTNSYISGTTWCVELDVQNEDIESNLNREVHVGSGMLPKVTVNDVNYISGGFSGLVKNFDCTELETNDDIGDVEKWRKFITANNPFLIRSPKGDVWIGVVTETSTKYDDVSYNTTVSVNFTEIEKVSNVLINYYG